MTGVRRLVMVGSAAALTAVGFLTGAWTHRATPEPPAVVDLDHLNPVEYLVGRGPVDPKREGVNEASGRAADWCGDHPDVCVGVVLRPEAAFIGLTRDHEETVKMLRRTLNLREPGALRGFRTPYSESDLHSINNTTLDAFLSEHAPDKLDVATLRLVPAMGRVLIQIQGLEPELARLLADEFGEDKIRLLSTIDPPLVASGGPETEAPEPKESLFCAEVTTAPLCP